MPFPITINGQNYPCSQWNTVSGAQALEKRYDSFNGGMGAFLDSQVVRPGQIYTSVNLDTTTFPYIRMRRSERDQTAITLTGGDMLKPAYGFVVDGPSNVEYLYIINSDRAFKVDLGTSGTGTPALEASTRQVTNGVAGRPVRFEGGWQVPWGASSAAETLTTVGAGAGSNDTWTDFTASTDDSALHFAVAMDENVAKLWKAYATNQMASTAAVADAFSGSDEVGDSSYATTDLLSVEGRLLVSRPDRPWWFDSQRNSAPALEFVGATGDTLTNFESFDGAMCAGLGPYVYWPQSSGLWRLFGDSAVPIDPFSQRNWSGIALDSLPPSYNTSWLSAAAWGRWIYATNASDGVYVGWIQGDGTVIWMGCILSGAGTNQTTQMRCGITTTSSNPILWVADVNERLLIIDLQPDGSTREISTDGASNNDRGGDNEQGQIWWPGTSFGTEEQKQLRVMSFKAFNNDYANLDIEARAHRDRNGTSLLLGSAITSSDGSGYFEFTPNTNTATITSSSAANPTVITATAHGFASEDAVTITGHSGSAPEINGVYLITVTGANTFTIPLNVTSGGTGGTAVGKRDAFYELMPAIRFDTNQASAFDPDPADPRIGDVVVRAVTANIYRALIPLTHDDDGMRGYSVSIKDALLNLRALKNGASVLVREPETNATFTGYIVGVGERAFVSEQGVAQYELEVFISRWLL